MMTKRLPALVSDLGVKAKAHMMKDNSFGLMMEQSDSAAELGNQLKLPPMTDHQVSHGLSWGHVEPHLHEGMFGVEQVWGGSLCYRKAVSLAPDPVHFRQHDNCTDQKHCRGGVGAVCCTAGRCVRSWCTSTLKAADCW